MGSDDSIRDLTAGRVNAELDRPGCGLKRADYAEISKSYDDGRRLSEQNTELWLELIRRHSGVKEGASVLDLGCGTGRFALPMAEHLGLKVIGADASQEMLDRAAGKDADGRVSWERVDAGRLPYAEGSFDVVWMSHLLHHLDDPGAVIAGCLRVLRPVGTLLVRYGAMEQIRADVEHTLFPEVLEIDEARTPSVQDVERWMTEAGFGSVESIEIAQETYPDGESHLEAIKVRSTSVLTLISSSAFDEGVKRTEEHVEAHPDDPWTRFDRMTLTVGTRR